MGNFFEIAWEFFLFTFQLTTGKMFCQRIMEILSENNTTLPEAGPDEDRRHADTNYQYSGQAQSN